MQSKAKSRETNHGVDRKEYRAPTQRKQEATRCRSAFHADGRQLRARSLVWFEIFPSVNSVPALRVLCGPKVLRAG